VGAANPDAGVHVVTSASAAALADRLGQLLSDDPLDPMCAEWLAVPTAGMRRWLMLELATHLGAADRQAGDGVAANIQPVFAGALLDAVYASSPLGGTPDPWKIERLVWTLLDVLRDVGGQTEFADIAVSPPGGSQYSRARRIADLFDRYHRHRPEMVRVWQDGRDVDGSGSALADHALWQPRLWRAVRASIARESPPERFPALLTDLADGSIALELPGRLVFFGFTSLPGREFPELIRAAGLTHAVHLFLLQPTLFDVAGMMKEVPHPGPGSSRSRTNDPTDRSVELPLLRSWGRLPRESVVLLEDARIQRILPRAEMVDEPADRRTGGSLLQRLQAAIHTDTPGERAPAVDDDRSVQFHSCFGAMRQVEVARDVILHLLADPGLALQEDDVLVICPKLDQYAPLVDAAFGAPPSLEGTDRTAGAPRLRYRIADQSIRSENPVVGAMAALLALADGRFEAAGVVDFLSLGPVRTKFEFDDDDLRVIGKWVSDANIRWGLDPGHRATYGLPVTVVGNSWQAGLDRLLLGAAVEDGTLSVSDVAPLEVEGSQLDTLARFIDAWNALAALASATQGERTFEQWMEILTDAYGRLLAVPDALTWQLDVMEGMLADIVEQSRRGDTASDVLLSYLDVRRILDSVVDDRRGRPDFFRGGVTVTSMAPLRWVPFRVICLLGLDQASISSLQPSSEDLIAAAPEFGDPDQRAEFRQALLEAVVSAGDHLVVIREGRDVQSNHEVRRSVAVAELFESVVALVPAADRPALECRLELSHPRHTFDRENLVPNRPFLDQAWSFDPSDLTAYEARRLRSADQSLLVTDPLGPADSATIDLGDLRAFLNKPVAYFMKQVLGVRLPKKVEHPSSLLPTALDALGEWKLGTACLQLVLEDGDLEEWAEVQRATGQLPPNILAEGILAKVTRTAEAIAVGLGTLGIPASPTRVQEVDLAVDSGTRLVGTVPLHVGSDVIGPVRATYSKSNPTQRLQAWLQLMVLQAVDPTTSWTSIVVARKNEKQADVVRLVSAHEAGDVRRAAALSALEVIVTCFRAGIREPLPLFPKLSHKLSQRTAKSDDWVGFNGMGEGSDEYVGLAFGRADYRSIRSLEPQADDPSVGEDRAQVFADYLWGAYGDTVSEVKQSRAKRQPKTPVATGGTGP
jgi:exodeoxyribonuclease V gamma subunit